MTDTNTPIDSIKRLRWACRRGLLELDTLLERFCEQQLSTLSVAEQAALTQLLQYSDPQIRAFILGDESPSEPSLKAILALIKISIGDSNV